MSHQHSIGYMGDGFYTTCFYLSADTGGAYYT